MVSIQRITLKERSVKYTQGYRVRQIVRASKAAPSFFRPEQIEVKPGVQGAFVDGGVTPHNNPALQLLMMATFKGFGLEWPLGSENLLLVSVGTGSHIETRNPKSWKSRLAMMNGLTSLQMLMEDTGNLTETILQWLSSSPTAREIDKVWSYTLWFKLVSVDSPASCRMRCCLRDDNA